MGEFGNLQRVSKTRDQWELSTRTTSEIFQTERLNSQRDQSPLTSKPLLAQSGMSRERFFGAVGAWINNELVRGTPIRVNCEWVQKGGRFWIVQLDGEDEDFEGINPHQISVEPWEVPPGLETSIVLQPGSSDIQNWDKLRILEELAEGYSHRSPRLFFIPADALIRGEGSEEFKKHLVEELDLLFGKNIVVRTSNRAGQEKMTNLPRTDCMSAIDAAEWCLRTAKQLDQEFGSASEFAFILHKFIDSKSSAWVRADPKTPVVEIHGTWGLPDALQYCPYDIWEVHLTQQEVTEYPEYKSHILLAGADGKWRYERVKNDVARYQSISKQDVLDIARRSAVIAERLGRPIHIMWFVGCSETEKRTVNIPWYWTEAHLTEEHSGRGNPRLFVVGGYDDLSKVPALKRMHANLAMQLLPASIDLFRDNQFLKKVAETAVSFSVPVYFSGSTLAHAFYQLQKYGCTLISTGDKQHLRVRRQVHFGKLVRDGIPAKIEANKELARTVSVPPKSRTAFLIGKCVEELLEAREAEAIDDRKAELADLLEVIRGLANASNLNLDDVIYTADRKRDKLGGFDAGSILLETSLPNSQTVGTSTDSVGPTVSLSRQLDEEAYEIPFNFFGFTQLDVPMVLNLQNLGLSIHLTLRRDSLEIRLVRNPTQLDLQL